VGLLLVMLEVARATVAIMHGGMAVAGDGEGRAGGLGEVRWCMGEERKKKHNLPRPIVCSFAFTGVAHRHMDELSFKLPHVTVVALMTPLMLVRRWWSMQGSTGTPCVGILI
jgi:hypothetical protein